MSKKSASIIFIFLIFFGAVQPFIWFMVYSKLRNSVRPDDAGNLGLGCGITSMFVMIAIGFICAYLAEVKINNKP